ERALEPSAVTGRGNPVSGRVGIAESAGAVDGDPEAPRRRAARAGAGDVPEPPGVAHPVEHRGVPQRDLSRLARRDREDPRAHEAVAGELDQRGIALATHDLLVNRTGLSGVHRLALELAVALPQREIAERGFSRQRIEVARLVQQHAVVAEPFLHADARHAARDRDLDRAADLDDAAAGHGRWWQRSTGLDPPLPG